MADNKRLSTEEKIHGSETSSTHVDAILNAEKGNAAAPPPKPELIAEPPSFDCAQRTPSDPKVELTEADCYDQLGYCFPSWKKMDHHHRHFLGPGLHEFQYQSLLQRRLGRLGGV